MVSSRASTSTRQVAKLWHFIDIESAVACESVNQIKRKVGILKK